MCLITIAHNGGKLPELLHGPSNMETLQMWSIVSIQASIGCWIIVGYWGKKTCSSVLHSTASGSRISCGTAIGVSRLDTGSKCFRRQAKTGRI